LGLLAGSVKHCLCAANLIKSAAVRSGKTSSCFCFVELDMATVLLEAEITPQMVAQAVRAMSEEELAALERELRAEKLRRLSEDSSEDAEGALPQENALLKVIQQTAPHDERFTELREAGGRRTLSAVEQAELARLVEEREAANVARVAATMRLAELRGVPFDELWRQLVGVPQGPRRVAG
jgi:hypothetical protein